MRIIFLFIFGLLSAALCKSQIKERPFIWASYEEKEDILEKIETCEWADSFFIGLKRKVDKRLIQYQNDKDSYLRNIPLDWDKHYGVTYPPFLNLPLKDNKKYQHAVKGLVTNIQFATDCAVLYYLTGQNEYAQCALDISYSMVMGLKETKWNPVAIRNGGWIYPDDNLRELRYMASLPVVYDFIYPYIKKGGKAYNLVTKKREKPNLEVYQYVFLTYARSAVEHGHAGSNWSVLEAPCLVNCALAMDDLALREKYLSHFLEISNSTQDCILDIAKEYKNRGDIWPETSQYSNGVAHLITKLMLTLNKYDSSLNLGRKYINIPWSLPRWSELVFPNGELVRFGDGHRHGGGSLMQYEEAYALAEKEGLDDLKERMAGFILKKMKDGEYDRPKVSEKYSTAVEPYYNPSMLLWCSARIVGEAIETNLPRTDNLSHAGLFLQRNLSLTGKKEDGLMAFVAGASHVHSHAGGMNIELYGRGEVLGVDGGRGNYTSDIHENYSRLYAAHNCVVSNGCSSSKGGWVNLGTSTVKKVSMEPEPWKEAISANYSYTTTSFEDKVNGDFNAKHERTLAVIRTSPTTGYYVDVFRAKSGKTNEFHDYIYHNIADDLFLFNKDIELNNTPQRFNKSADLPWNRKNYEYRHPGWHFFENIRTSNKYLKDVCGIFKAKELGESGLNMRFFILGENEREYSLVDAPATFDVNEKYKEKITPTVVIRKYGDAWNRPFAVLYEPTEGESNNGSIVSVKKIVSGELFKGLTVESMIDGKKITQYILIQNKEDIFKDESLNIEFNGHFAIISYLDGVLDEVYVGDGKYLNIDKYSFHSNNGDFGDFYINNF